MQAKERVKVGVVGVDSGQIMVTDPSYIDEFEMDTVRGIDLNGLCEKSVEEDYPYSYSGACRATCNTQQAGQLRYPLGHPGAGVVTSSGRGDGRYPVYVEYEEVPSMGRRVSRLIVEFLEDDADAK